MSTTVPIKVETLKSFADEARRLGEIENDLSTAEMLDIFEGVTKGVDLSNAEETFFGRQGENVEYSITYNSGTNSHNIESGKCYGSNILINETFALKGFRLNGNSYSGTCTVKLWDADTLELVAEAKVTVKYSDRDTWYEGSVSNPVNLIKGKRYTISQEGYSYALVYHSSHSVTTNAKVTYERGLKTGPANACPTEVFTHVNDRCAVGLVMGAPLSDNVITEYKIQTATMDDIADEVRRITGASGTMSTAQIITALQGIEAVTT